MKKILLTVLCALTVLGLCVSAGAAETASPAARIIPAVSSWSEINPFYADVDAPVLSGAELSAGDVRKADITAAEFEPESVLEFGIDELDAASAAMTDCLIRRNNAIRVIIHAGKTIRGQSDYDEWFTNVFKPVMTPKVWFAHVGPDAPKAGDYAWYQYYSYKCTVNAPYENGEFVLTYDYTFNLFSTAEQEKSVDKKIASLDKTRRLN